MATPPRQDPPGVTDAPTFGTEGWLERSGRNLLEMLTGARIASPAVAPFEVEHTGKHYRLRRYQRSADIQRPGGPLLLVPPLMVTAEIYDVSPELSAVSFLRREGLDVWGVDFGAPEHEEGGLERTLDDHLLAVDEAIDEVARRTGQDVHLVGYSQGGLFVYQVAAYRRGRRIASVITMGSPVDMRKNLPVRIHDDLVERSTRVARDLLQRPLELIDGLPGELTSLGFKLISLRKELDQYFQLLTILPDRDAVHRWRSRRHFLGGGGFVAWPGPALRSFVDEVLASNRLTSGGFVINGRIVTLNDITCPVLCFVGLNDDLAYPPAVRAIHQAAPRAAIEEVSIRAGHFGLVVGSKAFGVTWPTVVAWVEHGGQLPSQHRPDPAATATRPHEPTPLASGLWERLGQLSLEFTGLIDVARWERPRLARLTHVHTRLAFGPGFALARTASESPDDTFFLFRDRAFTHAEAHRRVQRLAAQLHASGVRPGHRVGLELAQTPDCLSALCAISLLGAEICPLAPGEPGDGFDHRVSDPAALPSPKGGPLLPHHSPTPKAPALDLAAGGQPDATLRLSNRAWGAAALHTAAVCRVKPSDTLYASLPLHHPLTLLCALPPSLIARTRLALGESFTADAFWQDVRRFGASVVFVDSEMTAALLAAPPTAADRSNSIRCAVLADPSADAGRALSARFRIKLIIGAEVNPNGPDHPSPLRLTPLPT